MKSLSKELDEIAGEIVRSRGACEKCGRSDRVLQWAHIVGRKAIRIRWALDNAFCLCHPCHFRFTNYPHEFYKFVEEKHGKDHLSNLTRRANDFSYKIDHKKILKELEQY